MRNRRHEVRKAWYNEPAATSPYGDGKLANGDVIVRLTTNADGRRNAKQITSFLCQDCQYTRIDGLKALLSETGDRFVVVC